MNKASTPGAAAPICCHASSHCRARAGETGNGVPNHGSDKGAKKQVHHQPCHHHQHHQQQQRRRQRWRRCRYQQIPLDIIIFEAWLHESSALEFSFVDWSRHLWEEQYHWDCATLSRVYYVYIYIYILYIYMIYVLYIYMQLQDTYTKCGVDI